jgi:hypothetical protein
MGNPPTIGTLEKWRIKRNSPNDLLALEEAIRYIEDPHLFFGNGALGNAITEPLSKAVEITEKGLNLANQYKLKNYNSGHAKVAFQSAVQDQIDFWVKQTIKENDPFGSDYLVAHVESAILCMQTIQDCLTISEKIKGFYAYNVLYAGMRDYISQTSHVVSLSWGNLMNDFRQGNYTRFNVNDDGQVDVLFYNKGAFFPENNERKYSAEELGNFAAQYEPRFSDISSRTAVGQLNKSLRAGIEMKFHDKAEKAFNYLDNLSIFR